MKILEKKINTKEPDEIDVSVIDAGFMIRSQVDLSATYGGVTKAVLTRIMNQGQCIDFVCDTYSESPWIKDLEHSARGCNESSFTVTGPEQKRPKEFQVLLDSAKFKRTFLKFLAEEWQKPIYADIIRGKQLYVGLSDKAWLY